MADQAKWQALMKWTMKHTDGTTPTEATPISEDKRRFLEMVMNEGVIDENERVKDILRILEGEDPRLVFAKEDGTIADEDNSPSPEELAQYKDTLLDELLTRIDQIDNAQNFVKMGGLRIMINVIKKYEQASSRALAAEVCSVVVQNNPYCQDAAVETDLVLQKNFFIRSAAAFITNEDVDLCESAVEGLAEFAMIGPDFMAACKKSEFDLIAKCNERIKQIDALEDEDKEFAQETKTRVEYLKKVLTV
ncbi:ATP-dependent Clp protease ATP-binding subunit ClpX [Phytophthora nicotianae]|uniref:ATP-dependent Clp protease ATP-binding subunit ClpX n=1 Tax=Phytophthora nicotianae TaxID=4792 RepID=A0A0W8DHC6_PHYNI|nr:ATP-dependent Clp protease ATP-binding subunit ClpX [Phytophthora nicotianae]